MIPVLIGAVLAQMVASVFLLYQLSQVRKMVEHTQDESKQTREQMEAELASVREMSTTMVQQAGQITSETLESLKTQLRAAEKEARGTDGKKKKEADQRVAELTNRLAAVQEQAIAGVQKATAAGEAASQAKHDAEAAKTQAEQVSSDVGAVRTEVSTVKTDVQKHEAELKRVTGEVSHQTVLIATNNAEMEVLKHQGDKNVEPFTVRKDNAFHRYGPIQISLKAVDLKKSRYTIEVMIDDNKSRERDKTIHELLQFSVAHGQILDLVVNELGRDTIVGYVAVPKAQQAH